MLNSTSNGEAAPRTEDVPKGSAWTVYRRLLAYTWQYKVRLMVSLLFAVFIAASFTTMLIAVREVVNITYYDAAAVSEDHTDPQESIVAGLHQTRATVNDWIEAFPGSFLEGIVQTPDLEPAFRDLVRSMRAERFAVMKVTCVLLVIFSLAVGIARFLQEFFAGTISANISTEMARNMYDNLMAQSVGFFETRTTGDVLARFTNDIFMVNRGLEGVLVKVMREPVKAVCFLGFALYTDPVLTLIGVCGLPPVALILTKIGMKMRKSVRRSLEKISSMASVVHETVNGIAIVKVFTMERYEMERVRSEIKRLRKFLYQMVRLHATTGPVTEFVLVIGVALFLLVAGRRMDSGQLDHGEMLTLLLALAMMLDPVRKLSAVNNMVQTSIASAERVFEFIDMRPDIDELKGAASLAPMREGIRFENVTFGYSAATPVLHDLDLFVKPGETIALVGHSGSGKSTIIKLIPRFYDVQSGTVSIDGTDIRTVSAESLREQISIVTQEPILFAETVRGEYRRWTERLYRRADSSGSQNSQCGRVY